jgi:zinc transport system substrate-binding protein
MRMRIIIGAVGVLIAAGVVVALATGGGSGSKSGTETIVAGFYPLAFTAQRVGGPDVEVENLTPPGAEPHDLEPTPQDVQALQSADLVLLLGQGFQPSLERAAEGAEGHVVELLDAPGLNVHPGDPHVWLDPVRFEIVVKAIADALGDPGTAQPLVRRLEALNGEYRVGLANCADREIVTSHEAFGYLADRYGLQQIAISGISPEAEPTPRALQHVVEVVGQTGATTVFTEPLVSARLADTVASETGAGTAVLDPIEGLTSDEQASGDDYFSLMQANLRTLERGLRCR